MSDLHCHSESAKPHSSHIRTGSLRALKATHPVESLKTLFDADPKVHNLDALLVPGDLADKMSLEGISAAWDLARDLAAHLRVPHLIPVLGNHDVDSKKLHPHADPLHIAKFLRSEFPFGTDEQKNSFFSRGFCLIQCGAHSEILVLNTVADHLDETLAKRGQFSAARVEDLRKFLVDTTRERRAIRLAMMHHHPTLHSSPKISDMDVLETGDAILAALREHGFGLVIHGHKHHPRLTVAGTPAGSVAVLAAGSVGALLGELQSITTNTFHVLEITPNPGELVPVQGRVWTWSWRLGRGWRPATEATDFPPQTGFGTAHGLPALVKKLVELLSRGRGPIVKEDSLLLKVPELFHLPPDSLQIVTDSLDREHAIELRFTSKGEFVIGKRDS